MGWYRPPKGSITRLGGGGGWTPLGEASHGPDFPGDFSGLTGIIEYSIQIINNNNNNNPLPLLKAIH